MNISIYDKKHSEDNTLIVVNLFEDFVWTSKAVNYKLTMDLIILEVLIVYEKVGFATKYSNINSISWFCYKSNIFERSNINSNYSKLVEYSPCW